MNEEKNYMDGIRPPAQKKSIKDIPMPPRKRTRGVGVKTLKSSTSKKNLDLRDEITKEKEPLTKLHSIGGSESDESLDEYVNNLEPRMNSYNYEIPETRERKEGGGLKSIIITISVVVAAFLLFVIGSSIFSGAVVTITPKMANLANLNVTIPVINETSGNTNVLNYKILEVSESSIKEVSSEQEETVESKASGVITVYNEYSTEPQKLIQNTRFETPDGLIYRIKDSISVPGYTESAGKKNPGTLDVEVFADQAGDKYNIGKTEFKVPGFKDQPQYDSFYAKSKSDMTGGFIGKKNTVSQDTLASISKELQGDITQKIINKINEQITDDYVYVYTPENFKFLEPKQDNASGNKVAVTVTGTAYVYVISASELSKKVAEKEISEYSGAPVLIENIKELSISLESQSLESEEEEVVQNNEVLQISGNASLVWQNDSESIKKDLAGKSKKALPEIMSNYPGVTQAKVAVKPFWEGTLPKNTDKIEVEISQ